MTQGVSTFVYRISTNSEVFYLRVWPEAGESFALAAIGRIRATVDNKLPELNPAQANLAHGDFDVSHIYHQDGRYAGIIDFGEIRGANRIYDLAHFNLHDGETLPSLGLPYLLEGYQELAPLPPDFEEALHLSTLLIAIRTLARTLSRPIPAFHRHCLQVIQHELAALQQ